MSQMQEIPGYRDPRQIPFHGRKFTDLVEGLDTYGIKVSYGNRGHLMNRFAISKAKYLAGCQCPKWLWYQLHRPEDIPEEDQGTQARFSEGHLVGEYAKKLFPDGCRGSMG